MYQVERQGLRITEIPIIFVERVSGTSKMSKAIVLEAVLHITKRRIGMLRGREPGRVLEESQPH